MEKKKAVTADVERLRPMGFLLGLVVAVALCFAALEFSVGSSDDELDMEALEEFAQELDEMSAEEQRDMIPAELPQEVPQQNVAETVREVAVVEEQNTRNSSQEAQTAIADKPEILPVEVPTRMEMDITKVPPVVLDVNDNPANLRIVQDTPKPIGGWVAFMKWLTKSLRYPPTAKSQKVQGTVLLTLVIDEEGNVGNVQVKKSVEPSLDREALRVGKMIRKWEPAMKDGKAVKSMVGIPIVFKL